MDIDPVRTWTFIIVGLSFALYIGIAWWAKAESTSDFYVAGSRVGAAGQRHGDCGPAG